MWIWLLYCFCSLSLVDFPTDSANVCCNNKLVFVECLPNHKPPKNSRCSSLCSYLCTHLGNGVVQLRISNSFFLWLKHQFYAASLYQFFSQMQLHFTIYHKRFLQKVLLRYCEPIRQIPSQKSFCRMKDSNSVALKHCCKKFVFGSFMITSSSVSQNTHTCYHAMQYCVYFTAVYNIWRHFSELFLASPTFCWSDLI